jgi:hypothetical protein
MAAMEIRPSARKHGIADVDAEHAVEHGVPIEYQGDGRTLYLGPSRTGAPLEVVKVDRADGSELVIHAMPMRAKYQRLLPGA